MAGEPRVVSLHLDGNDVKVDCGPGVAPVRMKRGDTLGITIVDRDDRSRVKARVIMWNKPLDVDEPTCAVDQVEDWLASNTRLGRDEAKAYELIRLVDQPDVPEEDTDATP